MEKARIKAEENEQLKGTFLENINHEFRTPMNGIIGCADILAEAYVQEPEHIKLLGAIKSSGMRLLSTLTNIIEMSRLVSNQVVVRNKPFNISELVLGVCKSLHEKAESKQVKIELDNELPTDCCINSDFDKIKSILYNLVKNAISYSKQGKVRVTSKTDKEDILLIVEDTGIGIPKDKLEVIFKSFAQADNRLKRECEGVGLGLSISKAYAELLDGELWVDSEESIGSTFVFKFTPEMVENKVEAMSI